MKKWILKLVKPLIAKLIDEALQEVYKRLQDEGVAVHPKVKMRLEYTLKKKVERL